MPTSPDATESTFTTSGSSYGADAVYYKRWVKVSFKIKWLDAVTWNDYNGTHYHAQYGAPGPDEYEHHEDGITSEEFSNPVTMLGAYLNSGGEWDDGNIWPDTALWMAQWINKTVESLPNDDYYEVVYYGDSAKMDMNNPYFAGFRLETHYYDAYVKDLKIELMGDTSDCDEYSAWHGRKFSGNQCTCFNGLPTMIDCPLENGGEHCRRCHVGYHLENNLCVENVCYCPGGVAATAQDKTCLEHNTVMCTSCDGGAPFAERPTVYHDPRLFRYKIELDGKFYTNDDRACCNGLNAINEPLINYVKDGVAIELGVCDVCSYDSARLCTQNSVCCDYDQSCKCENGEPATLDLSELFSFTQTSCHHIEWDKEEYCGSCDDGYELVQSSTDASDVGIYQYMDANIGSGIVRKFTWSRCQPCQDGFHKDAITQTCVENQCQCFGGQGTTGINCLEHNSFKCLPDTCTGTAKWIDFECVTNKRFCSCYGGETAPICTSEAPCTSCDTGFTFENNNCIPNQCTCANGTGLSSIVKTS